MKKFTIDWHEVNRVLQGIVLTTIISLVLFMAVMVTGMYEYNINMLMDIFRRPFLFTVNFLPILITGYLFYAITNKVWAGGVINSLLWLPLGLVDYFMLKYRSTAVRFSDISLIKEAKGMGSRYSYNPSKEFWVFFIALVIVILLSAWFMQKTRRNWWVSGAVIFLTLSSLYTGITSFYMKDTYYYKPKINYGNVWNGDTRYMTNGIVYSFLNTIGKDKLQKPAGYTKETAQKIIKSAGPNYKLTKKHKINILELQLEAFQDFSKWESIGVDPSVYAPLKRIQEKSLHGELTTSYFGGGTIDAERKIITGLDQLPTFTQKAYTLLDYYKDNGYTTTKQHPGYAWFYHRQKIAPLLGFDKALFKENYYNKNVSADSVVPDNKVFKDFIERYRKTKTPQFNQLITYQNHGPYSTEFNGQPLIPWKDTYNKADYAIINNYLTGVKQTTQALEYLVNSLENDDKPLIIEFHGDHNPWGGENNSTFKMLGINLDQSTSEGYGNYYNTPYVIYANKRAKSLLRKDLQGQGENISPKYMLPLINSYIGIKGSSLNQLLTKEMNIMPVRNIDGRYRLKGSVDYVDKKALSTKAKKIDKDMQIVNYYLIKDAKK